MDDILKLILECYDRRFAALEKSLTDEQKVIFAGHLADSKENLLVDKTEQQKEVILKFLDLRPSMKF